MKENKRPKQSVKMQAYWDQPGIRAKRAKAWKRLSLAQREQRLSGLQSPEAFEKRKETLRKMSPAAKKRWLAGIHSAEALAKGRATRSKNAKEVGARLNTPEVVAKRSIGIKAAANTAPGTAASWTAEARANRIRNRTARALERAIQEMPAQDRP